MSLTPDPEYRGKPNCVCCGKPMGVNDAGITYHAVVTGDDVMFCAPCVIPMIRSIAQDVMRLPPETAFEERWPPVTHLKTVDNLQRSATVFKELSAFAGGWAECCKFNQ